MTIVINMYGGPGTGKSTFAAKIFSEMKCQGLNCELITEYAKDLVWRQMHSVIKDEIYVFAKQQHRLRMVSQHVDYVVTDSPLLLPIIYDTDNNEALRELILQEFNRYCNINFMLRRFKPYCPIGRLQTEEEANTIDGEIEQLLMDCDIPYIILEDPSKVGWKDLDYCASWFRHCGRL